MPVDPPHALPRSLPRGRHAVAREVVVASQRWRLLEAIAACVAEHGYAATTVTQVIARAGVSRKTFYEQFTDKRACFLAAWEVGFELLLGQVAAAVADARGWEAKLREGARAYLEALAAEPTFARSFLIEVLGAGDDALARRAEMIDRFAALIAEGYEEARAGDPTLGPLPSFLPRVAAGAIAEMTTEHVRRHGVDRIIELAPRIEQVHRALAFGRYDATS